MAKKRKWYKNPLVLTLIGLIGGAFWGFLASYYFTIREENINRSHLMTNIDYAKTQAGIGDYYLYLSSFRDKEDNLYNSIKAFGEALKIFTPENYPDDYLLINNKLIEAQQRLSEVGD